MFRSFRCLSWLSLFGATHYESVVLAEDVPGGSREPSVALASPPALRARLPPGTPAYFRKSYVSLMQAPRRATSSVAQSTLPGRLEMVSLDVNPSGAIGTFLPDGAVETADNAFFRELGTNGRSCATCHQPDSGMSISVRRIQRRFRDTRGRDPLFAPVDGANCPNLVPLDEDSENGGVRDTFEQAHSLLLTKGLIRIPLPVPADAEFTISVVSDPTTCNLDPTYSSVEEPDGSTTRVVSVFRRPAIATNLDFKTTTLFLAPDGTSGNIMWDGREPTLFSQAVTATLGHAQALTPPTEEQLAQIVEFETRIFSAQLKSNGAGRLDASGVTGGPIVLSQQAPGQFVPQPFDEFTAWAEASGHRAALRRSIARGQQLFSTKTFTISAVAGFNDFFGPDAPPQQGTCATCHNINHAGSDGLPNSQRDIGVGGQASLVGGTPPETDVPIFLIENCPVGSFLWDLGSTSVLTNDPGRALITGRCRDVGSSTVPTLRGLAAREPFFRDGSAQSLKEVVSFYDARFSVELSAQEQEDLVNFLLAL